MSSEFAPVPPRWNDKKKVVKHSSGIAIMRMVQFSQLSPTNDAAHPMKPEIQLH